MDAHIALTTHFANREEDNVRVFTKTKHDLIHKYVSVVYEYLAIMNASETIKSLDCQKYTIQLGLSAITHIYKLAFCNTKNVSTSADHCQKGIYCFIEYIEQTHKLGFVNPLTCANGVVPPFDFTDALVFIYDKTISELRNCNGNNIDEQTGSSSAFSNILSVSQSHQAQGDDFLQCRSSLDMFGRVASVLLWFNNARLSLVDQMDIIDAHLIDMVEYSQTADETLFTFIETVQDTVRDMEKQEYMEFLDMLKKKLKKSGNKGPTYFVPACLYLKTVDGEKGKKWIDELLKIAF